MLSRSINELRVEIALARLRVARLLTELEAAWTATGGRDGASLYTREPRGAADPDGCGACRGTGIKGDH